MARRSPLEEVTEIKNHPQQKRLLEPDSTKNTDTIHKLRPVPAPPPPKKTKD
jgi:hypothetical protein